METTLVFQEGIELPHFASCDLLRSAEGRQKLRDYYRGYAALARQQGVGFIIESATWRSNPDWSAELGYNDEMFRFVNKEAITLCQEIKREFATASSPMVVSGCIGPRGDGYQAQHKMTVQQAMDYHQTQIDLLRDAGAELISAMTITYHDEAAGIVLAARQAKIPVVISFTVETDGHLPSGETLQQAIESVDKLSGAYTAYYMINCAHPSHFRDRLHSQANWCKRIYGIRANASCKSHAELDESTELDEGNPVELGQLYTELLQILPHANILGGCCGTGHAHISEIHRACAPMFSRFNPR